ncbi:MAG: ABC-F family ATP-binding cassette domain-containing protein [bacterium]|nr:ABC-F family ATP-binding cassette domain-containing protein [bacterium]
MTKSFGGKPLFSGVSLHVRPEDRIGLVGRNGAGKSTLMRILSGRDTGDDGQIRARRGARVGYLKQEVDPGASNTVMQEALKALASVHALEADLRETEAEISQAGSEGGAVPERLAARYDQLNHEFERAGGFEAEAQLRGTLVGLGLGPEKWDQPLSQLSGGWLMRVELAKLLVERPEVLLLDEPTNHLDLPSIAWFEGVLSSYPGAVVVVSHDRTFLDRHVTQIAELELGKLDLYKTNYSGYVKQKALRSEEIAARRKNLDREIAHKTAFVERFGAKATKARQATSRKKQLDKLHEERSQLVDPKKLRTMRVRFESAVRSGDIVLRMEQTAKAYADHVVYQSLDFELRRGDRVALVGPNGAGKSTLLRLGAGALSADSGVIELGHNVNCAYFAQHQLDALTANRTVLEELSSDAGLDDMPRLRGVLGAFLFSGDDVEKRVSVLSGGEKSRLALAKLLLKRANFLVLDEPTNHLDIEARDVLTQALENYDGTLMLVSHDRRFINALANRVVEVTAAQPESHVRSFYGNYDDYRETLDREAAATRKQTDTPAPPAPSQAPQPSKATKPSKAAKPTRRNSSEDRARRKSLRTLKARGAELEARIESDEAEIERISWLCAEPEVARDGERMRELQLKRRTLETGLAQIYDEWERVAHEIEATETALAG